MEKPFITLTEINPAGQRQNQNVNVESIVAIEENVNGRVNCLIYFTEKDLLLYSDTYDEVRSKLSKLKHWEKPPFIDLHKLDGPDGKHDHREYVHVEQIKSIEKSAQFGGNSLITLNCKHNNTLPFTETPEQIREFAHHCSNKKF